MKHTILFCAAAALCVSGQALETDYTARRTLRIETETTVSMETTNFEIERDGEPMNFGGGGGMGSEESMRSVELDTVLAHENGRPTRVRRVFDELESTSAMSMRGETRESESDCQLAGCVLEISVDEDGETSVELVEGDEPDDDEALEGHRAALALDAFLPTEPVEVGDAWDLEPRAIRRALGVDLRRKLFPRPERERDGEREGDRGRGRGPGGSAGRGGAGSLFGQAEWEGRATLASVDDEYDGEPCAVIEVELGAAGDLPDPEWGGGGGRRQRGDGFVAAFAASPARALESEYEIEIEGRVYVSLKEKRPLGMELEGTLLTDTRTERERGESTIVMSVTREGTYERTVTIKSLAVDEEDTE